MLMLNAKGYRSLREWDRDTGYPYLFSPYGKPYFYGSLTTELAAFRSWTRSRYIELPICWEVRYALG